MVTDAHEGRKASIAKVMAVFWQRRWGHVMRNVPAHAGRSGWRVVSVFIATAFAQEDADGPVRYGCRSPNCAVCRPVIFQERRGRCADVPCQDYKVPSASGGQQPRRRTRLLAE